MTDPTLRELVAAQIKTDNPAFIVKNYPVSAPDNLGAGKVFISVYRESLTPIYREAAVEEDLRIVVITATNGTEAAELALEAALDAVLTSCYKLNYVLWQTATRSTFVEKFIGYEITLQGKTENSYKNSALNS